MADAPYQIGNNLPFGPSMVVSPPPFFDGSLLQILWPLLTSWHIETESIPRPPSVRWIPFGWTLLHLLWKHSCYGTLGLRFAVQPHPAFLASYTVSVRQFHPSQSRLLQCLPHDKPPCDLLHFGMLIPRWETFTLRAFLSLIKELYSPFKAHTERTVSKANHNCKKNFSKVR
jgi:hypothetical protein